MFSYYTLAMFALVVIIHIATTDGQKSSDPVTTGTEIAAPERKSKQRVVKIGKPGQAGGKRGVRRRVRVKNGKRVRVKVKAPNQAEGGVKSDAVPVAKQDQVTAAPMRTQKVVSKAPTKSPTVNALVGRKETAKVKVARRIEKKIDTSAQDEFFGLFDGATTTVGPNSGGPPPEFDPNRPPGEKVMPQVDLAGSKAYDGTPCNETYQPHETIKTKYMMRYAEGVWETLDCPPNLSTGLVWRQDLCSCGEELIAQDPNDWCAQMGFNKHPDNPHKYNRRHHGVDAVMDCAASLVWSQEKCLCIFDPTVQDRPIEQKVTFVCKTILQLKFDGNLKNAAEGYYVQPVNLRRRGKLPRIRYRKVPGSKGKAAMIVSQPLEFLAYRGNDFQLQVTYSVSFKVSPRHNNRQNFMQLMTDECITNPGGQNKSRIPSISLAFQPNTRSFRLQFRTEKTEVDEIVTGAKPDKDGWYNVVVYFEDRTLNLENNGLKLFTQADLIGKIPQNKCPLYIAGRGQGYDRSEDFYGYLDNVNLIKDCKFHEANIKFL